MYLSKFNKPLEKFKNIYINKSAILFTTGPSIKKYKKFDGSQDTIKVGVNHIYDYPFILKQLDYYFFGSGYHTQPIYKENIDRICKNYKFQGMAASYENGRIKGKGNIHPDNAYELGAIPFENNLVEFSNDIANYAFLGHSIVFPVLQFLLYTGVNKIYLVGCDIYNSIDGEDHLLIWWNKFKKWYPRNYPNVEIISINPRGLKGFFSDYEL